MISQGLILISLAYAFYLSMNSLTQHRQQLPQPYSALFKKGWWRKHCNSKEKVRVLYGYSRGSALVHEVFVVCNEVRSQVRSQVMLHGSEFKRHCKRRIDISDMELSRKTGK